MRNGSGGQLRGLLAGLMVMAGLAGCRQEDPRTETLTVGISKDSVLVLMGGAPAQPYAYLADGQYIEAMIYTRPDVEGPVDSLQRRDLMPVVLVDGRLTGWGWDHWDSVAGAHRIEVVPSKAANK